jgi:FlaG/FlaF family flagellin (archaellin)
MGQSIAQQAPASASPLASEESAPATASAEAAQGEGEAAPAGEPGTEVLARESAVDAAARAPLEGAITDTEARRAEAMGSYESTSGMLAGAVAGALALPGAISFAPEPGGTPVDAARRDAARVRAEGFFSDAASRLAEATAFALEDVPSRLGALAESLQASISSAMEEQKAAISAGVEQARGAVFSGAEGARQQVLAEHATAVATVESETAASIASLQAAYGDSLGRVDEQETTTLDGINALYESARTAHETLGTTVGDECLARGEEYVQQYEGCKIGRADGFWVGHLTDRRAEAQQKAARETAKGYHKSLVETAKKQAQEAMRGRRQDRCGVIAAGRSSRDTLDTQLDSLISSLESGRDQAIARAATLRDTLLASIESALMSELDRLDAHEHGQRQAINDTGYLQQVVIEQVALSAAASLQSSVAGAIDTMQQALATVRDTFAEHAAPDTEVLERILSQATGGLEGGLAGLVARVEGGAAQAEARLAEAGGQGLLAMGTLGEAAAQGTQALVESFTGSMSTLAGNAASAFGQQRDQYSAQARGLAASGTAGFEQVVTGFQTTCSTITTHIGTALEDSAKHLEQGLRESKAGLDCEIPKQAREAASREQPAWKTVVAVVLIIAIIVVVALVIGPAVIGAVGAAASALGAGAAAATIGTLVGGAIVGAATSATIQVINNWSSGRRLSEGVGRAALMGAIGGVFGAGAGALIQHAVKGVALQFAANIAADAVLEVGTQLITGEFSWEALGMSVLMSAVTGGFGEIPRVKSIQQGWMARGAGVVPGARARAHAEAMTPRPAEAQAKAPEQPAAARLEDGEPSAPRPVEEPGSSKLNEEAEEGYAREISGRKPVMGVEGHTQEGQPYTMDFRKDLSGRAQGLVRKLEKNGWVRIDSIHPSDLVAISKWFGKEIGVLQMPYGKLRMVLGTERGVLKSQIRPGEVFVVHTHPVFRSNESHFKLDLQKAGRHTEAVVDFSGQIVYFNKTGVLNPESALGGGWLDPMPRTFQAAFMDAQGRIVGYSRIDVTMEGGTSVIRVTE